MDRRQFILGSAGVAALSSPWQLWATSANQHLPRLVFVFLRGAYDSISAVVPYADAYYYESRPNIALARPNPNDLDATVALDNRWALHPVLDEPLRPFWDAGELAFVPFAGTDFVSRSHFEAQDKIEYGVGSSLAAANRSGFLNRLVQQLGSQPEAVALTASLPIVLQGSRVVGNSPFSVSKQNDMDSRYELLVHQMYQQHPLEPMVAEGLGLRDELAKQLAGEMKQSSRKAAKAEAFSVEAENVGRFLNQHREYNIAFLDIGGWDTHIQQGAARGQLTNRLRGLGQGLAGLKQGLGSQEWDRTTVVVLSEFGRTFRENGSKGTDHGHGTTLWVMGGSVRGGIRGEQTTIKPGSLHQDRDLPVLNEYRATLGGLFARMYGLSPSQLDRVFPGSRPVDIGLV